MQNLKQTLADRGLVGSLTLRENGTQLKLRFERGQAKLAAKLLLGPAVIDVDLVLEEIPSVDETQPNLRLVIQSGAPSKVTFTDTVKVQTAAVEAAAKKEADDAAEAKATAEADVRKKLEEPEEAPASAAAVAAKPVNPLPSQNKNQQNSGGVKKGN